MTTPINSVSPERLDELARWAASEEAECLQDDMPISAGYYADIIKLIAARRAANTPVDGVSIKPLEWGDHDSLSIIAHTVLGPYLVEVINSPRVALWLPNMTGQARKMIEGFDSVEDAKAAAQADFNARIQACLTSPAAEPVAWMTEATDGLPPEKRGTTADPQTAEYWRSTSNVIPLYTHPAPSASGEVTARPLDEWQESDGDVVWWCWRDGEWLGEPAYLGSPLNLGHTVECHTHAQNGASPAARFMVGGWPGYHTHWTPHPERPALLAALPEREG